MQEPGQLKRPESLTDAVVMSIRDDVIAGRYVPGQQLAEATLAQTLGTSRGTIREAMRVLADLGLVSLSAHRGGFVTTITPERAREIYTMRALLESFAARIAVERGIDSETLANLEVRLDAIVRAATPGDVTAMVEADMQFHLALSAAAGHRLLIEHLAAIHTHSRRLLVYSDLYRPDFEVVVGRHLSLIETIRAGDPEAVERAVSEHITQVGEDIVARMIAAAAQPTT
jgi:DNA-binding GntR family transcriptional regulator